MCIPVQEKLVEKLADEFVRAVDLIERIDESIYARTANGTGSIGGHFRHNLDFVANLLNGISEGKIDYEVRERDILVETEKRYAVEKYIAAIRRIVSIPSDSINRGVLIRSEIKMDCWHTSSVSRELEFVLSHTVHHHALIKEKLVSFGVEVSKNFGVAPSTLKYWEHQNA